MTTSVPMTTPATCTRTYVRYVSMCAYDDPCEAVLKEAGAKEAKAEGRGSGGERKTRLKTRMRRRWRLRGRRREAREAEAEAPLTCGS